MRLITLEHLRIINLGQARRDRRQVTFEIGVWLAIALATPFLRMAASYLW